MAAPEPPVAAPEAADAVPGRHVLGPGISTAHVLRAITESTSGEALLRAILASKKGPKEVIDDDSGSNVATLGGEDVDDNGRVFEPKFPFMSLKRASDEIKKDLKKQNTGAGTPTSTTSTTTGGSDFDLRDIA